MTDTVYLEPHDPMPEGPGRHVIVLRRFEEESPDHGSIQIILTGEPAQTTHPHRSDGSLMPFDEAVAVAGIIAVQEGISRVFVIDRLQGGREQDIIHHRGDHSVNMAVLSDTDEEDGERGSDMRDVTHPHSPE